MSTTPAQRTVLVVDDDPVMLRLVVAGLEGLGDTCVLEAGGGEEAQRLLGDQEVDVVVTDLDMPGMDGIELLRWAREHRPEPVWVVLSGVDAFEAALEAIHCGAFDFLKKPPHAKELVVTVRNALEHRALVLEKERLLVELQASSVELLEKLRELERTSEVIQRDLERAQVIQRALLPARPPPTGSSRVDALYRPGRSVGGDLYDVVALGRGRLALYVADATGHGVSAAMLSVLFKQRLEMRGGDGEPLAPAEVLRRVHRELVRAGLSPGLFLTAAYGLYDTQAGELRVASAGHTPLFLRRADGGITTIERTGPALGLSADADFEERRVRLATGDRLLIYTDGVVQGLDGDDAEEAARRLLQPAIGDEAESGIERLRRLFREASLRCEGVVSEDERDDVTLLLLEGGAGPSCFDNGSTGEAGEDETARAREPLAPSAAVLWVAERAGEAYVAVRGRGIWSCCDTFHRFSRRALDRGLALTIDLALCSHLDSTFLGTLHEIVCHGAAGDVRIRGAREPLQALFDELGLERVSACAGTDPATPPAEPFPVRAEKSRARDSQLRLLRAHETLASLSEQNRKRFEAVVGALRAELGE